MSGAVAGPEAGPATEPPGGLNALPARVPAWERVAGVAVLLALSFQRSLDYWEMAYPFAVTMRRSFTVAGGFFLLALAGLWIARRAGCGHRRAVAGVGFLLFLSLNWNTLWDPVGSSLAGRLVLGAGLILGAAVMFRLGDRRAVVVVGLVITATLVVTPLAGLLRAGLSATSRELPVSRALLPDASAFGRPDVYVIVLDAYARGDVLRSIYGYDNAPFLEQLEQRGFVVPPAAIANYGSTFTSVPSLMSMNYVLRAGEEIDVGAHRALQRLASGANPVVESFTSAGYRYVHVEGGLAQSRCGPAADRCVHAPILSEAEWMTLERTPLRALLRRRYGSYFTVAGRDRLARLHDVVRDANADPTPSLVFAHVLLPHPPMFLDATCSFRFDQRLDRFTLGPARSRAELRLRRDAYVEQLRCVNDRLLALVSEMDPDAVVLITADHGPDSMGQLLTGLDRWTDQQARERLSIMQAYRIPGPCRRSVPDDVSMAESFRVVLSCLSGEPLERVEPHLYIHSDGRDGQPVREIAFE